MALETVFLRPRFINFMRTLWKTEIKDIYILTWSNNPLLFNVIKMTSVHFWLGWWGRCFICLCSVLQVGLEATVMIESETSETTTERHSAICLLSAASTPFHFHTNPTANAISNWRCHPLTFDAGVNAVSAKPAVLWRLKSLESSVSVPCYAERQTDLFCMFIILHLVNLA